METTEKKQEEVVKKDFWKSLSAEQIVLGVLLAFALIGLLDWLASVFNSHKHMKTSWKAE